MESLSCAGNPDIARKGMATAMLRRHNVCGGVSDFGVRKSLNFTGAA